MKKANIGNVVNNYGKKHYTTITSLNGESILNKEMHPHTIVVSAPVDISKNDIGNYSLFVTDNDGIPARLTYTIKPGNGLIVGVNNKEYNSATDNSDYADIISLGIDNNSLTTYAKGTTYEGSLYVNKQNIIDNDTLHVVQSSKTGKDYIKVITNNLDKASQTSYGVVKPDDITIKSNNGIINVRTEGLTKADNQRGTDGIVKHNTDPARTIDIKDGILNVVTSNLEPASYDFLGVVKPDNTYTFVNKDGILTVENFRFAYNYISYVDVYDKYINKLDKDGNIVYLKYEDGTYILDDNKQRIPERIPDESSKRQTYMNNQVYGIFTPDAITTYVNDKGFLNVVTEGLDHAKNDTFNLGGGIQEQGNYGIVKPDGKSIIVNNQDLLCVKNYGVLNRIANDYYKNYADIIKRIDWLEAKVIELQNAALAESIILDIDNNMSALDMPKYNNGTVISNPKYVAVQLQVTANCKFYLNCEVENNFEPAITLQNISVDGVNWGTDTSKPFDIEKQALHQITLVFYCENYIDKNSIDSSVATRIMFKLTSINDESIYKKVTYTILRYNTAAFVDPNADNNAINPDDHDHDGCMFSHIHDMEWYDNNNRYVEGDEITTVNAVDLYNTSNDIVRFTLTGKYQNSKTFAIVDVPNENIIPKFFKYGEYGYDENTLGFPQTTVSKTDSAYFGYLKTKINYSYAYYYIEDNEVKTSTYNFDYNDIEGQNPTGLYNWAVIGLESSYIKSHSNPQTNVARISSISGIPDGIISRTAAIAVSAYCGKRNNVSQEFSRYAYYIEEVKNTSPDIIVTTNLSDTPGSYLNIAVERPQNSIIRKYADKENGYWGGTVTIKYVDEQGRYVNPENGSLNNDYFENVNVYGVGNIIGRSTLDAGSVTTYDGRPVTHIFENRPDFANIKSVKATLFKSQSFTYLPNTTFYTRNIWNINNNVNTNYKFANAEIRSLTLNPWDNNSIKLQFTVIPGSLTNIPNGAIVKVQQLNVMFINDTVTHTLNDDVLTSCSTSDATWDRLSGVTFTMTINSENKNILNDLSFIQYVQFWFELDIDVNGVKTLDKFVSSKTLLSNKYGIGDKVSNTSGFICSVGTVNGNWNVKSISSTLSTQTINYQEQILNELQALNNKLGISGTSAYLLNEINNSIL